ncbi:MAG: hypothetical protein AAF497_06025 [Planctomycetota bacterium]
MKLVLSESIDRCGYVGTCIDAALMSECEAAKNTLRSALAPINVKDMAALLGRLRLHCRNVPTLSDTHWKLVVEDYQNDLGGYPLDIFKNAVDEWRRTQPWWPTISDLRAIAEPMLTERRRQFWRLVYITEEAPKDFLERRRRLTDDEMRYMAWLGAGYLASNDAQSRHLAHFERWGEWFDHWGPRPDGMREAS